VKNIQRFPIEIAQSTGCKQIYTGCFKYKTQNKLRSF